MNLPIASCRNIRRESVLIGGVIYDERAVARDVIECLRRLRQWRVIAHSAQKNETTIDRDRQVSVIDVGNVVAICVVAGMYYPNERCRVAAVCRDECIGIGINSSPWHRRRIVGRISGRDETPHADRRITSKQSPVARGAANGETTRIDAACIILTLENEKIPCGDS